MRPAAEAGSDNAIPHPPVECITIGCPDVLVLEATLPDAISTAGVPMTIECCHANHCEKAELSNGPSPLVDDVGWSIRFGDNPWAQIVLSGTNNRITVAFWGNPLDSFNPGDRYSFELFASDGTVIVRDERIVDYEVVEIGCNHCQHAVPRE
jgi:hypothetical protein